jgi:hypothetical protein
MSPRDLRPVDLDKPQPLAADTRSPAPEHYCDIARPVTLVGVGPPELPRHLPPTGPAGADPLPDPADTALSSGQAGPVGRAHPRRYVGQVSDRPDSHGNTPVPVVGAGPGVAPGTPLLTSREGTGPADTEPVDSGVTVVVPANSPRLNPAAAEALLRLLRATHEVERIAKSRRAA